LDAATACGIHFRRKFLKTKVLSLILYRGVPQRRTGHLWFVWILLV
jgi:hypothetical protein